MGDGGYNNDGLERVQVQRRCVHDRVRQRPQRDVDGYCGGSPEDGREHESLRYELGLLLGFYLGLDVGGDG